MLSINSMRRQFYVFSFHLSTAIDVTEDDLNWKFYFIDGNHIGIQNICDWVVWSWIKFKWSSFVTTEKRGSTWTPKWPRKEKTRRHVLPWIFILIAVKWYSRQRETNKQHIHRIINHSIKWWHHRKSSAHWEKLVCCMQWPNVWHVHQQFLDRSFPVWVNTRIHSKAFTRKSLFSTL